MDKHLYYQIAHQGSLRIKHPGMQVLQKLATQAKNILDLGCGEGTRLNFLVSEVSDQKETLGVDISKTGIKLAQKSFPQMYFLIANLEKLPIKNESFDLVYSAFVLEHLDYPEKVLDEAIRVTAFGGHLVLIAPNFGAPNRVSPPFQGSRFNKFINGVLNDLLRVFFKRNKLNWQQVKPIVAKNKYDIDWDTTVEPYIGTLIPYLISKGLKIEKTDTCWSEELLEVKLHQKIFKLLGNIGLYPFWMWGPHLLIVIKK